MCILILGGSYLRLNITEDSSGNKISVFMSWLLGTKLVNIPVLQIYKTYGNEIDQTL
jgi:maltoporin